MSSPPFSFSATETGRRLSHQSFPPLFLASREKFLVRWPFQRFAPNGMKITFSNVLLACLMFGGVSFLKPSDSQAQSTSPASASHQPKETNPQGEEAKLRATMKRAPNDPSYPARLGALLAGQNKLQEAAQYFEKALKLNPSDLVTRRNLAAVYWQL